jgi:hypothetical protein
MPSKAAVIIILTVPINQTTKAQREIRAALGHQHYIIGTGSPPATSLAVRQAGRV